MNRAAVERKDPLVVLKEIAAESAANIQRIVAIASEQSDEVRKLALNFTYVSLLTLLLDNENSGLIAHLLFQGYVEFHMLTPRYRLEELGIKAE